LNDGVQVDACLTKPVRQSHLLHALTTTRANRLSRPTLDSIDPPPDSRENAARVERTFSDVPRCVLVVDDNAVNQRVAMRMLERLGLRIDVAANGLEAVRMVSQQQYDAVLMDCQMPEMDGYAATREIRRMEQPGGRIAIIAMTAEALTGARERCVAAGMDDYISKPVRLEDLTRAIHKWLPANSRELTINEID
jgi:two-component system sensor histidine kinase/response regulator